MHAAGSSVVQQIFSLAWRDHAYLNFVGQYQQHPSYISCTYDPGLLKTTLLLVDWRLHAFLLQSRVVDSRIIKFCLWLLDMYFKRDCCQTCCFHAVALKTYDGTRCCAARTTYTSTGFWKLLITTRCNHECIQAGASWRWSLAVLLFWRAQFQSSTLSRKRFFSGGW